MMDPALYAGQRAWSTIAIVNWRQQLGAFHGGPLALDVNLSIGNERTISGPLTVGAEVATRDPYLGISFETLRFAGVDVFPLPVTDQLVRNIRTNSGLRTPYLDQPLNPAQGNRVNPYGMQTAWPNFGLDGLLTFVSERRLRGRWGLDWRPDTKHQVTLGVEAERTDLSLYQSSLIRQAFMDAFVEQPTRYGLFASDRVNLHSAVLDIGLRYDHITPGGEFPTTPGRIFTHPAWDPAAASSDAVYRSNVAAVFTRTASQGALSPRVRLWYALSPNTSVRAGFGRYFEPPPWAAYFQLSNADLSFTNAISSAFGRDVKFATTTQFDFGVRSPVGRNLVLDVGVYRKDLPRYAPRFTPFADPRSPVDTFLINALTLIDAYGLGADVLLDWRAGGWLTGSAAYSLLRVQGDRPVDDYT